jgi:hypothetical protein
LEQVDRAAGRSGAAVDYLHFADEDAPISRDAVVMSAFEESSVMMAQARYRDVRHDRRHGIVHCA